jgi:tetratricopeptide (TPR) repeat protein
MVALMAALSLAVVATSDEPKSPTNAKPQWQRLVTGADADKVAELDKRLLELEAADNYAEAIRVAEELLTLLTRLQGSDHWHTVNVKWHLIAAKKVAVLPKEKRAGWRQAFQGEFAAERLEQKAQYGKALPLQRERLKWCQEVLGEDHLSTANSYNNVAYLLDILRRDAEAEPLFRKALEIFLKVVGEDHPNTAIAYRNTAGNLSAQARGSTRRPNHYIRRPWKSAAGSSRTMRTQPRPTVTSQEISRPKAGTPRPGHCIRRPWTSTARC